MYNTALMHFVCFQLLYWLSYLKIGLVDQLSCLACFLYLTYLLATCVDNVLPRFRVTAANKAVFITGCDRGFGRLLARRLDSLGYKVFAGCLDPGGADTKELTDTVSSELEVLPLDVTRDDSVRCALETVRAQLQGKELWAVVNNAGVIERGELEWTPMEVFQKQLEVNTLGVVRVTQAFLPLLRKSKGRVVTVTSIGGRQTYSGFVPYCMSKYATTSFCEGLRVEMSKFGVKVITVEPFSYQTGMTDMSTVLESVQTTWKQSAGRFRGDVYDYDYIRVFSECIRKFNALTALPDPTKVVDLLVEAVCAESPHYSYVPGDVLSHVGYWLSRRSPVTAVDAFLRTYVTFDVDLQKHLEEKAAKKKNA